MTDKNNDEYQFPHDEYVTAEDNTQTLNQETTSEDNNTTVEKESTPDAEDKGHSGLLDRFPILHNKRLFIVIGVVVVALIGFQMIKPEHKTTIIKTTKPKVQAAAMLESQQRTMLVDKISHLAQATSNTQQLESQLHTEMGEFERLLHQSVQSNQAISKAMIALTQQVAHLSTQIKKATTKPNRIKKLPPAPVLSFHLRAVIPGRAWIEDSEGGTASVTVGSKVKNYGIVRAIEVEAGRVLTSSGKVITYNEDGN